MTAALAARRLFFVLGVVDEDGPAAGAVVIGVLLQSLYNVLGNRHEGLVHVRVHFRRSLEKLDPILRC